MLGLCLRLAAAFLSCLDALCSIALSLTRYSLRVIRGLKITTFLTAPSEHQSLTFRKTNHLRPSRPPAILAPWRTLSRTRGVCADKALTAHFSLLLLLLLLLLVLRYLPRRLRLLRLPVNTHSPLLPTANVLLHRRLCSTTGIKIVSRKQLCLTTTARATSVQRSLGNLSGSILTTSRTLITIPLGCIGFSSDMVMSPVSTVMVGLEEPQLSCLLPVPHSSADLSTSKDKNSSSEDVCSSPDLSSHQQMPQRPSCRRPFFQSTKSSLVS